MTAVDLRSAAANMTKANVQQRRTRRRSNGDCQQPMNEEPKQTEGPMRPSSQTRPLSSIVPALGRATLVLGAVAIVALSSLQNESGMASELNRRAWLDSWPSNRSSYEISTWPYSGTSSYEISTWPYSGISYAAKPNGEPGWLGSSWQAEAAKWPPAPRSRLSRWLRGTDANRDARWEYEEVFEDVSKSVSGITSGTASRTTSRITDWSSVSEQELALLAFDASPLQKDTRQAWGSKYLQARRTNTPVIISIDASAADAAIIHNGQSAEEPLASLLRGGRQHSFQTSQITSGDSQSKQQSDNQFKHQSEHHSDYQSDNQSKSFHPYPENQRKTQSWTVHGPDQPLPGSTSTSDANNHDSSIEPNNHDVNNADINNVDAVAWYNSHYNTNYTLSSLNPPPLSPLSHTLGTSRQRLLTGSYAAWQWYDRDNLAQPTNLDLRKLSRVNYAFFQTDSNGYIFGTDSWADPNILFGPYDVLVPVDTLPEECRGGQGRDDGHVQDDNHEDDHEDTPCPKFEQCHRNFPNSKSCNVHKHQEGLIYLAHKQGAQIYPSIGGWTLSGSFPSVASDPEKRRRFAQECVGLIQDYGFDGIDIDWEYPGYEPHGGSPADRLNFNKLLLEVRIALNDYQADTGDEPLGGGAFGLTAALPCGPANIEFLDVPFLSQILTGMNLMTFDFHNEFDDTTGVNSPLYYQGWGEEGLSVDGCVEKYYEEGAANEPTKMSIGIPFYGHTYAYASQLNAPHNKGIKGERDNANWPQDLGTPVFYNILEKLSDGDLISKRHEASKTQFAYFKDNSGLVSYDDPQAVCDKVEYIHQNRLGGVFVWELSGDLTYNLETPLLDSINRKLTEPNFECRLIAAPEDGAVLDLPPMAPKGPRQYQRRDDQTFAEAIIDHLNMAEDGELSTGGAGEVTRSILVFRTHLGTLFPSYQYRFEPFLEALNTMATEGINGDLYYLGESVDDGNQTTGQNEDLNGNEDVDQATEEGTEDLNETQPNPPRQLQDTTTSQIVDTSLVYGLVNIAAFLAQAMTESIIHDACDELNVQHLPESTTDSTGFDDGNDQFRFPISNACGQFGRSYQDERCTGEDSIYDCFIQHSDKTLYQTEAHGVSRGHWGGAPGAFYCGPKTKFGTTGFWDAMEGREIDAVPIPNDNNRTDVEGCCWWGRGALQIKGTCLYGKLNYHIGRGKALRDGRKTAMYPDINFCKDPGQICSGSHTVQLRWITGLYAWMENVQKYSTLEFDYKQSLLDYVNGNLADEAFFEMATNVHVLGCHSSSCAGNEVTDMDERLRNFEKVLTVFGLQFGSHATVAEPPFDSFPGQIPPTSAPSVGVFVKITPQTASPTLEPTVAAEIATTQVNIFLTGVKADAIMTPEERSVFDTLMLDLLTPRLETVGIGVTDVITDSQYPNADFTFGSNFDSTEGNSNSKEANSVLRVLLNVTLSFYPPPPDGWRDWSIYLKSWVESFGNTMVEIFTNPQHLQHPDTNSNFWDGLVDVSATNVPPPSNVTTEEPTSPPTYIIYPEPDPSNDYIIIGAAVGGSIAFLCLMAFIIWKCRKSRKQRSMDKQVQWKEEQLNLKSNERKVITMRRTREESSEEESDEDSESSSDSSSSGSESSDSSSEGSDTETVSTRDTGTRDSDTRDSGTRDSFTVESDNKDSFTGESDSASESASESEYESGSESVSETASEVSSSALTNTADDVSTDEEFAKQAPPLASDDNVTIDSESESTIEGQLSEKSDVDSYISDELQEQAPESSRYRAMPIPTKEEKKEIDEFDELVQQISVNDPTLTEVFFDNKQLGLRRDSGEPLFDALANNSYVERLSLRRNNIDDDGVSSLSSALVENKSITHLWLGGNEITSEGAEYLIGTLGNNQTIVYLELEENPRIDPELQEEVRAILEPRDQRFEERPPSPPEQVPPEDEVVHVMDRVRRNDSSLTEVDLSRTGFGKRFDYDYMIDAFVDNTHVWKLDLHRNDIDDDCASSISLALVDNKTITHLNLSDNSITSEGAEYLIGTLDSNKTLREINLESNLIDSDVLQEIYAILEERRRSTTSPSPPPQSPRYKFNSMSLQDITQSLKSNDPNLTELQLERTDLGSSGDAESLINALALNTVVTKVGLDNTGFDDTLVAALSLSLVDNRAVTHVSLRNNQITSEGCEYLLGTLDSNTTVAYLELDGNQIEPDLIDEINDLIRPRQRLPTRQPPTHDDVPLSVLLQRVRANDPALTELMLDGNQLADCPETERLFDALGENSHVTKLSLQNNEIDDSLVASLSLALVDNTSITHIWLNDNLITSGGCEYLLGTLDTNEKLIFLDLDGNYEIEPDLLDEIEMAVSRNLGGDSEAKEESYIDLDAPPMFEVPEESDTERAKRKVIMNIMRDTSLPWPEKNQRIQEAQKRFFTPEEAHAQEAVPRAPPVSLPYGNGVTTGSIQEMIDRILDNDPTLKEVDLDGRDLTREEEGALYDALTVNTYVTTLSLRRNKINNEGVSELCYALAENTTLKRICLIENSITSNGALEFIEVLKDSNVTLQELELEDNRVRSGLIQQLNKILEVRRPEYRESAPLIDTRVAPAFSGSNEMESYSGFSPEYEKYSSQPTKSRKSRSGKEGRKAK